MTPNQSIAPDTRYLNADMEAKNESALLKRAQDIARLSNVRLTPIREKVFRELARSGHPVGAYDLVDRLSSEGKRLAPVTIYRALEFLCDLDLVHRVATQNAYVVSHTMPEPGTMKLLFVSPTTGLAKEVISAEVGEAIRKAAEAVGFTHLRPIIEIIGDSPAPATRR